MIKIITKKLIPKGKIDIMAGMLNKSMDDISNDLKSKWGKAKCPNHPDVETIIEITATKNNGFDFRISKCCCDEFRSSFKFEKK